MVRIINKQILDKINWNLYTNDISDINIDEISGLILL